jgi:DNA transformation protein
MTKIDARGRKKIDTGERKKKEERSKKERGPLKSMRVSMGFREFVLDQLGGLPDLRAKAMFGGVGLYADDVFFGMMAADLLYLKVDESNRRDYEAAGSKPFAPYADPVAMTMPYYSVPADVLESAPTMVAWAKKAIAVAKAAKSAKTAKRAKKKTTSTS